MVMSAVDPGTMSEPCHSAIVSWLEERTIIPNKDLPVLLRLRYTIKARSVRNSDSARSCHQSLRHASGMIFTPSGRVYAICPPVSTIRRSGSRIGICFSSVLCCRISSLNSSRWLAPSSISRLPSLHSMSAYLPSSRCRTISASGRNGHGSRIHGCLRQQYML